MYLSSRHTDVCSRSLLPAARGPPERPAYHSLRGGAAATAQKNRQRAATQLPAIITLNRATQDQLKLRRWRDDRDGTFPMSTKNREEVPDCPALTLPQTGWHRAEVYAAAMDMTWRSFRDNVTKNQVPHRMFGDTMLILAEDFYRSLPPLGRNPDEPPKRKRARKRLPDG